MKNFIVGKTEFTAKSTSAIGKLLPRNMNCKLFAKQSENVRKSIEVELVTSYQKREEEYMN